MPSNQLKTYEELRSIAFKELNLEERENADGELIATDEQWAWIDNRVNELQQQQHTAAKKSVNEITSEIGQFLAIQTDHMKVIRDHIPNGVQNFHFFLNDKEINWYEFWNQVSERRPSGTRLETDWYVIGFSDAKLKWEVKMNVSDSGIKKNATIVADNLNAYELQAKTIRNWVRYNQNKS